MIRQRIQLSIVDVGYGGAGVARTAEGVVFVPGAFLGERVEVEIIKRKKRFAQARLLCVLEPSADRIVPETEVVPGMPYAALRYEAEVALKQRQLQALLLRIGHFENLPFLHSPVASPISNHYRNKLTLHFDGQRIGYIGEDNRTVIETPQCPLSATPINEQLSCLRTDRQVWREMRPGQRVVFRYTPQDGVVWWVGQPPRRQLTEKLSGLTLLVAADAFFQVNPVCSELLLKAYKQDVEAASVRRVFDLYCGCGLFGLAAVQVGAKELLGLETSSSAVASAQENARRLGVKANYLCAPSEALPDAFPRADMWVVDPPRGGLSEAVRTHILRQLPPRLIYVSCGPDTLARDLMALSDAYQVARMQLFDFFPRTAHFETLTTLVRR